MTRAEEEQQNSYSGLLLTASLRTAVKASGSGGARLLFLPKWSLRWVALCFESFIIESVSELFLTLAFWALRRFFRLIATSCRQKIYSGNNNDLVQYCYDIVLTISKYFYKRSNAALFALNLCFCTHLHKNSPYHFWNVLRHSWIHSDFLFLAFSDLWAALCFQ